MGSPSSPADGVRHVIAGVSLGSLVLAAAIPFLFVHERYHPSYVVEAASTSIELRLSDAAVVAVLVAALASALGRRRASGLGAARPLWITGTALLAWLAFEAVRPASLADEQFESHAVSFAKLAEYALLTVAVPLLVRRTRDLAVVLGSFVLWGALASAVALVQFFGLDVFDAWNPGWRQPSFLGHHDLAALSVVGLSFAAAGIVAGRRRLPASWLFVVALAAGGLGLVLAGSGAAALGLVVGAAALWLAARARFAPSRRQLLALVAVVVVVGAGVATVRDRDVGDFLRFLGLRSDTPAEGVESYSHRTVLAYIGVRIFRDDPIVGVGWLRSSRPEVFEPYVDDARARFPDVVEEAFPAEGREWGVQNLYVQMLADAGVIGLLLLLVVGGAGIVLAWRTARHAANVWAVGAGLATLCALLTLAGEWASLGIVAGIPLEAATSLLLGLAAAGAVVVEEESAG